MKIAILTQPLWFNYGGILQNFALQKVLIGLGHEVYTIDRCPDLRYKFSFKHLLSFIKRLVKCYILGHKNVRATWNPGVTIDTYMYISKNTLDFVKKNINLTELVSPQELERVLEKYQVDAYIIGSDQVWIPSYYPEAFIPFDNRHNVKKIFYAASSGATSWLDIPEIRNKAIKELQKFNGISVREIMLKEQFQKYSNLECQHVLDPTLLIDKSEYVKLIKNQLGYNNYIFSYILDNNEFKKDISLVLSLRLKKDVISGMPQKSYNDKDAINNRDAIYAPIEDWLYHYNNADFIITDSFHGTAFAILFNKQFVVIANKERGANRFHSLLTLFGLNNRLVSNIDELENILNSKPIDYCIINSKIIEYRKSSIEFLLKSLNN